jgi:hypothetical protein
LRAIGAVFGAAAAFNVQKGAQLNRIGVKMTPVQHLRIKKEIVEGPLKQPQDLIKAPIVAYFPPLLAVLGALAPIH